MSSLGCVLLGTWGILLVTDVEEVGGVVGKSSPLGFPGG